MKICKNFLLVSSLFFSSAFAKSDFFPIHLRLKFDKKPVSVKHLWERRILPDDRCWAEESTAIDTMWNPIPELPRRVRVGLVLAGGGDRGIAHIGVLRALEENNIPIHAIAGTSMGAIVGGLYACGYDVDTLEWIMMNSIDWRTIFSDQPPRQYLPLWERLNAKPREPGLNVNSTGRLLFPIRFDLGTGLRTAQKFTDELAQRTLEYDYHAGFDFDSLSIPYGALLVDINKKTKNTKLKRTGTISTAARASGSLPLVFEPMIIDGVPYIDGGVLDDLPVDAFINIDPVRGPDTTMNILGKDTINYVIAVYPLKMRGERSKVEESPGLSGVMGINLKFKTADLARNYHLWNSWDSAHAKIDADVSGMYEFSPEKIQDKIRKGYDAALKEIYYIKRQIAAKEDILRPLESKRQIYRVLFIRLFEVNTTNDTKKIGDPQVQEKIRKAVSLKEGSFIEKIDICDALKRIYDLGDFEDVEAKIENTGKGCIISFFIKEKKKIGNCDNLVVKIESVSVLCNEAVEEAKDPVIAFAVKKDHQKKDSIVVKIGNTFFEYDSTGIKAIEDTVCRMVCNEVCKTIREKNSPFNFDEIKNLVERSFIARGFVGPRVGGVTLLDDAEGTDTLFIHVERGEFIKGVKISCAHLNTKRDLEREFSELLLCPEKVLKKAAYAYKEFQLKTITVEGYEKDTLIIAAEKKSTLTLEFPSIALENVEGLNLFGELRVRRWLILTRWFTYSPYLNYTHNFPLKLARELPRGQRVGLGFQRCRSFTLAPDIDLYWKRMRFSSGVDTFRYDIQFDEIRGQLTLPLYLGNFAFAPGLGVTKMATHEINEEWEWQEWQWHRFLRLSFDNLDRITFPEKGLKADFDAKIGNEPDQWWRARMKIIGAISPRVQDKLITFTARAFVSKYSEDTPYYQRYSLGGLTPIGSYQLKMFDAEDLIGHKRNEFMEPFMWKAGGSIRIALVEMSPLEDLRFNIHLQGSFDIAEAVPSGESPFSRDRLKQCPSLGLYFDTNYLNIGVVLKGKQRRFLDNFHISVVYYGLGF